MTAPGAPRAAIGWAALAIGGLGVVAAVVMRLAGGSADEGDRARAERRARAEALGTWSGDDDEASLAAARARADMAAAELARAAADDPTAAAHVAMADDPATSRLVIDDDGLTLDGAPVDDATLAARLADAVAADPDLALTITATPAVPHGRVVELMSAARAAGVHRLSFASAVTVTAPAAVASGATATTLQVRLGATAVFVDGDPVDDAALPARFRAAVARDPDVRVVVEADASLPYARVVAVLDAARAAGVASIGMAAAP